MYIKQTFSFSRSFYEERSQLVNTGNLPLLSVECLDASDQRKYKANYGNDNSETEKIAEHCHNNHRDIIPLFHEVQSILHSNQSNDGKNPTEPRDSLNKPRHTFRTAGHCTYFIQKSNSCPSFFQKN